ncbi:MAG: hypothetical protein P9M14_06950 [Candidatus Alcyoniella australis]|nr:hypothetical protein [Candidatus Alcyoniella australis]
MRTADSSSRDARLLGQLEGLAERLGVRVSYETIAEDGPRTGALGTWRGERLLLVDRRLPISARLGVLRRELGRLDLERVYISPALREFLARAIEG